MPGSTRKTKSLLFATSNPGKLLEARTILASFEIGVERIDAKGIEIQADTTGEVASFASRAASRELNKPVMVEDAGLFVDALGGFPGVYSAYAFKTIGPIGILALLEGKPRGARFVSSAAYCEPAGEPRVFDGSARGKIAENPMGSGGFGFDPIFIPHGSEFTFAQLSLEEKSRVSHRADALRKFGRWYSAAAEK